MKALVLSGGANFGALQAGALETVFETGYRPEFLVGTSAGALNAISVAADPTTDGVRQTQELWRRVGPNEVGSISLLSGLQRLITQRPGLISSRALADFIAENLPPGVETFGQLRRLAGVRAYALATCIETAKPRLFGGEDDDRLLDGAMASTAISPVFPPWRVDGRRYIDGAMFSKAPIRTAVERGATQVVALTVANRLEILRQTEDIVGVASFAFALMVENLYAAELEWARSTGIDLRVISLMPSRDVAFWDYTKPDLLIEHGRELARKELRARPLRARPSWRLGLRRLMGRMA